MRVSGARPAEPVEMQPVRDHVLLGLEEDDVHFGGKQAPQDHEAAQADGDAHGCGLDLKGRRERVAEQVGAKKDPCGRPDGLPGDPPQTRIEGCKRPSQSVWLTMPTSQRDPLDRHHL